MRDIVRLPYVSEMTDPETHDVLYNSDDRAKCAQLFCMELSEMCSSDYAFQEVMILQPHS